MNALKNKKDLRREGLREALFALLKDRRSFGAVTLELQAKKACVPLDDAHELVEQLVEQGLLARHEFPGGKDVWFDPTKGDPFAPAQDSAEEPEPPAAPAPAAPQPAPRDRPHLVLAKAPEAIRIAPRGGKARSKGGKASRLPQAPKAPAPAPPQAEPAALAPVAPQEAPAEAPAASAPAEPPALEDAPVLADGAPVEPAPEPPLEAETADATSLEPAPIEEPPSTEPPAESEERETRATPEAVEESTPASPEASDSEQEFLPALDPQSLVEELLSWPPGHMTWLAHAHTRFCEVEDAIEEAEERLARLQEERTRWRRDITLVVEKTLHVPRGQSVPPIHLLLAPPPPATSAPAPATVSAEAPSQASAWPAPGTLDAQVLAQLDPHKGKRANEIAQKLKRLAPSVSACLNKLAKRNLATRLEEGVYVRRSA